MDHIDPLARKPPTWNQGETGGGSSGGLSGGGHQAWRRAWRFLEPLRIWNSGLLGHLGLRPVQKMRVARGLQRHGLSLLELLCLRFKRGNKAVQLPPSARDLLEAWSAFPKEGASSPTLDSPQTRQRRMDKSELQLRPINAEAHSLKLRGSKASLTDGWWAARAKQEALRSTCPLCCTLAETLRLFFQKVFQVLRASIAVARPMVQTCSVICQPSELPDQQS